MSPQELLAQIERDERWLRGLGVEVEPPQGLELVKHRVRLAVDEAWLTEQNVEPPSASALAGVKARIRQELMATATHLRPVGNYVVAPTPVGRAYPLSRSFAAAAALLLAAGLGFWSAVSSPDQSPTAGVWGDLAIVMSRDFDDDELEWESLDAALDDLEEMFAQASEPAWDDDLLDELDDEIEALMTDFDLSADVS